MRKGIAIGALVAVLAATGASAGSRSAEPTAAAAAATPVSMKDNFFAPLKAKVTKGGKVRWTNRGTDTHNATGGAFGTGDLAPGASRAIRFTRVGKFPYVCTIHNGMRGKVKVLPPA